MKVDRESLEASVHAIVSDVANMTGETSQATRDAIRTLVGLVVETAKAECAESEHLNELADRAIESCKETIASLTTHNQALFDVAEAWRRLVEHEHAPECDVLKDPGKAAQGYHCDCGFNIAARTAERFERRQQELLATIVRVTNETPFPDEIKGWTDQRAKLVAEVGTLRARVTELEQWVTTQKENR